MWYSNGTVLTCQTSIELYSHADASRCELLWIYSYSSNNYAITISSVRKRVVVQCSRVVQVARNNVLLSKINITFSERMVHGIYTKPINVLFCYSANFSFFYLHWYGLKFTDRKLCQINKGYFNSYRHTTILSTEERSKKKGWQKDFENSIIIFKAKYIKLMR